MKSVIFDFDGVIHDTFELIYGINQQTVGLQLTRDEYRSFFDGNIYAHKEITPERSRAYFEVQNQAFPKLKMDPVIQTHLRLLRESYDLYIVTSNQEVALASYFLANDFIDVFTDILGQETDLNKTKKFHTLFERYSFGADDCVFVTDTLGDVLEGHEVGVRTIAVDFGFHDRERLMKGDPWKIVSDFGQLVRILQDLQPSV